MAGEKSNLPNQAAEDTVFSNLGMTREELGVSDDDDLHNLRLWSGRLPEENGLE